MGTPTTIRDTIVAALNEHGPMTCTEIADVTGLKRGAVNSSVCCARKNHGTDIFVISGYEYPPEGKRGGIAAIFKAGPGKDAVKKVIDKKEAKRLCDKRYWLRHRARLKEKELAKTGSVLAGNPFSQLIIASGAANAIAKSLKSSA